MGVVYQVQHAAYNMAEFEHGPPEAGSTFSSSSAPMVLSQLRAPTSSEIMCKQEVHVNNPPLTGARKKNPDTQLILKL